MATKEYSEEIKKSVLARIPEVGVKEAAKEAGVPWQAVTVWKKAAEKAAKDAAPEVPVKAKKEKKPKKSRKKATAAEAVIKEEITKPVMEPEVSHEAIPGDVKEKDSDTPASEVRAELKETAVPEEASALEIENAVLKSENKALKAQVEKLKKAVQELM